MPPKNEDEKIDIAVLQTEMKNTTKTIDRIDETVDRIFKKLDGWGAIPTKVAAVEEGLKEHKQGHWKFFGVVLVAAGFVVGLITLLVEIFKK